MPDLYRNIRNRRKELHMTQTELALKVGYADKSAIAKIEKGVVDLPINKIKDIARALDTTASDLFGWDGVDRDNEIILSSFQKTAAEFGIISQDESAILDAYRKADELHQKMVKEILGVK